MGILAAAFPVVGTTNYDYAGSLTYTENSTDPVLNQGLTNSSFTFMADDDGGTETMFAPKAGATAYFTSSGGDSANGLIGWGYGSGRVLSFSTLIGPTELEDPNYSKLFANSVNWVEQSAAPVPLPAPIYGGLTLLTGLATLHVRRRLAM